MYALIIFPIGGWGGANCDATPPPLKCKIDGFQRHNYPPPREPIFRMSKMDQDQFKSTELKGYS